MIRYFIHTDILVAFQFVLYPCTSATCHVFESYRTSLTSIKTRTDNASRLQGLKMILRHAPLKVFESVSKYCCRWGMYVAIWDTGLGRQRVRRIMVG